MGCDVMQEMFDKDSEEKSINPKQFIRQDFRS
jgi:hypothetical protein